MKITLLILATLVILLMTHLFNGMGAAQTTLRSWSQSPQNWKNNQSNWDNSPANWDNNPANWKNNPARHGNRRTILDDDGHPTGYAVPKAGGGFNIFDSGGTRRGYTAADDWE